MLSQETLAKATILDVEWINLTLAEISKLVELNNFKNQSSEDSENNDATASSLLRTESGKSIAISSATLPWHAEKPVQIPLDLALTQSGKKFYLASVIAGKDLKHAWASLTKQQQQNIENMFNSRIQAFIDKEPVNVRRVHNQKGKIPIFYFGNKGGQRAYFMQLPAHDFDAPVIIRMANCDKNTQLDVLSAITNSDIQHITQSSGL